MSDSEFELASIETATGNFKVIAKTAELNALMRSGSVPEWLRYAIVPETDGQPTHEVQMPVSSILFVVRELPKEKEGH